MIDFGFALFLLGLASIAVVSAGLLFMLGIARSLGMLP